MNTTFGGVALSLLFSLPLFSQTPIAGIINHYSKVSNVNFCDGQLTVTSTAGFAAGDRVLIMQMKGATINQSNGSSFGNIENIGTAGFYEQNEILSISGTTVSLRFNFVNNYDAAGSVQLITMPVYEKATVTDTLKAAPWNGESGGVIAMSVSKKLTLDAPIDASGKGFRGGNINVVSSDCNFLTNADDYYYNMTNWKGAPKGEGIAAFIAGKEQGRGAQANGGGGGNDHNAGGGGGANVTQGGTGGNQNSSGFGCDGENPGKGGKPVPQDANRIFFGGGGGAGHVDDNGAGSKGGNGGGIIIIIADSIVANGQKILANGGTPSLASGDGAGGGGAGGSILLKANKVVGDLLVEAKGGSGGNVNNPSSRCFGAGGAGSGGRLLSSVSLTNINLQGGNSGVNMNPSGQCGNPTNGAENGVSGLQGNFSNIPSSTSEDFETVIVNQPASTEGCDGVQVSFEFKVLGPGLLFQWQVNDGSGWENIQPGTGNNGVYSSILTLFNPQQGMDNHQFRCVVNGPCTSHIFSQAATLTIIDAVPPSFDFNQLGVGSYQFTSNAPNATSFHWDFGDGESSDEPHPQHTFADFGDYEVILTVNTPCGTYSVSHLITVATLPQAGFTQNTVSGCAPLTVHYLNTSSANAESYAWYFPGGAPAQSTLMHPTVVYLAQGTYNVTLVVANTVGTDTFTMQQLIGVSDVPAVNFDTDVNGLDVSFVNLTLNAAGGYLWDFGDGTTSTEPNPDHQFPGEGFFNVTLTAYNACGESTITQIVSTGSYPSAKFLAVFDGGCEPLTVQFFNQSTGGNISGYTWSFPGGIPATSTETNPEVFYPEAGVYDVFLTVTNPFGEHTAVEPGFVVVESSPTADFTYEMDGKTVYFNNQSVDGDYFHWDFGDGTSSTELEPVHIFSLDGIYNVVLTVSNGFCGSAISYEVLIDVTATGETPLERASVFPNPVHNYLTISIENKSAATALARILDVQGRSWEEFEFAGNLTLIDVSALPPGMYVVELKVGNQLARWKVVKD